MIRSIAVLLLVALWGWMPAAATVSPDTVVATIDGRKFTAGELDHVLLGAPPRLQASLRKHKRLFVQNFALVNKLAEMARRQGLAEKSPYKQQLEWARFQTLWQAAVDYRSRQIQAEGVDKDTAKKKLRDWMDSVRATVTIHLDDSDFFSSPAKMEATPPKTQVVTVNGEKLTAGDIRNILIGASPDMQQRFHKNPTGFIGAYGFMKRLVEYAEKNKLLQKSPYREQLQWVRQNQLMQAELNAYSDSISIGPEQEKEYYQAHRDNYLQAKVKVLYISFLPKGGPKPPPGKKVLTEEQAKAKITELRKKIAAGADFVALVKKYSEDEVSRKKDGDFGTIHYSDKIPKRIKDVIFSLKPGEVSRPVRQPNGYYLFRVEKVGRQTLDQVRQTLNRQAKEAKFNEWFTSIRDSIAISYNNKEYFAKATGR